MLEEEKRIKFEKLYYDDLRLCGCGNPNEIKQMLHELILLKEAWNNRDISHEEFKESVPTLLNKHAWGVFEFIFHSLEGAGMMDHGSSVYSSWMNDKGEEFLGLLDDIKKFDYDED